MDVLRIELPYPPSVNHYYVHTANGVMLSTRGKRYRRDVVLLCNRYRERCTKDMRLCVTINVYPPDKRARDLDNICKATLDALEHAKVFANDSQIDMLTLIRRNVIKDGFLQIWISECC